MSSSDKLAEFIADYNDKKISLYDLERRLSFDQWNTDKSIKPLLADYIRVPRNPLDILIEEETQLEKFRLLLQLRKRIGRIDWRIISLIAKGFQKQQVAKMVGHSPSYVTKRLNKVRKKLLTLILKTY